MRQGSRTTRKRSATGFARLSFRLFSIIVPARCPKPLKKNKTSEYLKSTEYFLVVGARKQLVEDCRRPVRNTGMDAGPYRAGLVRSRECFRVSDARDFQ